MAGSRLLACPFYLSDLREHARCREFTLRRLRDIRQHIQRRHLAHCSQAQIDALKESKNRNKTLEEQYTAMWKILFPGKDQPLINLFTDDAADIAASTGALPLSPHQDAHSTSPTQTRSVLLPLLNHNQLQAAPEAPWHLPADPPRLSMGPLSIDGVGNEVPVEAPELCQPLQPPEVSGRASSPKITVKANKRKAASRSHSPPPINRLPHKRKAAGTAQATSADAKRPFACPYYLGDPISFGDCRKNTLRRIVDVRQHLMRKHKAPIHCPRCGEVFVRDSERQRHFTREKLCDVGDYDLPPGVTPDQMEYIRRCGEAPITGSVEERRWYKIWDILFPDSVRPESPYYSGSEFLDRLDAELSTFLGSSLFERSEYGSAGKSILEAFRSHVAGREGHNHQIHLPDTKSVTKYAELFAPQYCEPLPGFDSGVVMEPSVDVDADSPFAKFLWEFETVNWPSRDDVFGAGGP